MQSFLKKVFVLFFAVLLLLTSAYALFEVSRSRTFQFFGGLTSRVQTDKKVVALTFDDGPTEYTDEVLDTLKKTDTKATFFLVGGSIEERLDVTKRIAEEGHEIGNHSYSHTRMVLKTPWFVREEIEKTDSLIRKAGYKGEIFFRPPYTKKLFALPLYLKLSGKKTVTYDVEPETYGNIAKSSQKISDYVLGHVQPGSIVLLHHHYNQKTREALPKIIKALKGKGYEFVTVSELMSL